MKFRKYYKAIPRPLRVLSEIELLNFEKNEDALFYDSRIIKEEITEKEYNEMMKEVNK